MSLLEAYQNLVTSQHRAMPHYMTALTALLQHSNDIFACAVYIDDDFDLDLAIGAQEDVLGVITGESRVLDFQPQTQPTPVLDNETYRTVLRSRIAKNCWKGGIEDLEDVWETLFGDRIKIIDNQDMTIEVLVEDVPSSIIQELIARGRIVPKPQSVRINYNFIRHLDSAIYFGGAPSVHYRYEVSVPLPTDQDETMDLYIATAPSQHKRYTVYLMVPEDQEAETEAFFSGFGYRYKRYSINPKS